MSIAPPTSDDNKEESVPLNPVDLDLDESDDDENADIPDEFLCPVTREVMVNPVVTLAGHTYEREAIEEWFLRHSTDPLTGAPLASRTLIANHALRKRIESYFRDRKLPYPSSSRTPLSLILSVLKKHSAETLSLVTTFDILTRNRQSFETAQYPVSSVIELQSEFRRVQGEIVEQWTNIFYNTVYLVSSDTNSRATSLVNIKTCCRIIAYNETRLQTEIARFFESISGHLEDSAGDDEDDFVADLASVGVLVGALVGGNTGGATVSALLGSAIGPVGTVGGALLGFYFGAVAGAAPPALISTVLRNSSRDKETGLHTVWRSSMSALRKMNVWLSKETGLLRDINESLERVIRSDDGGFKNEERWKEDATKLYEELNARVSRVEEQKQLNQVLALSQLESQGD